VVGEQEVTEEPTMNTLNTNPTAAQFVAHQLITERVQDAERRRVVKAIRAERRASARALRHQPAQHTLPRWTLRFLRPAH
jgi:hypothetical protein